MNEALVPVAIALIAALYSSVGHGGASGYLAFLTLLAFPIALIKPSALVLNLLVSAIAFVQFKRAGHFRWALFWPFAITSIPFSYIGAGLQLDPTTYARVLGVCLLAAVARLLGLFGTWEGPMKRLQLPWALALGAAIGFVSGAIGIGGGILLSPLLLLLRWSSTKESAAVSALFIFVNSAAGITRYMEDTSWFTPTTFLWIVAALIGAALGSALGARRLPELRLRQVLGVSLLLASFKLLWT